MGQAPPPVIVLSMERRKGALLTRKTLLKRNARWPGVQLTRMWLQTLTYSSLEKPLLKDRRSPLFCWRCFWRWRCGRVSLPVLLENPHMLIVYLFDCNVLFLFHFLYLKRGKKSHQVALWGILLDSSFSVVHRSVYVCK